ncbi:MAG TPA: phosphatase PAP2 family protein [Flavobacteriales bacterium]|nr:phosphatase PAP2 family protein [Flavobacteriales bacterium]
MSLVASLPPAFTRRLGIALLVSGCYLALSAMLIGFKADQLVLVALFSGLYLATDATRRWVLGFAIFMVYWVLFDWMKAFPNYAFNPVHIGDLYAAERSLFGVTHGGALLTPNEFLSLNNASWKDLLAGLFYLCWVPVPLAFAGYLYATDKPHFLRFALCFLLVNLLGFTVYYLYPAAPPWYVAEYGTTLIANTPGNTAGLGRFDALTGLPIFHGLYNKSSNVFAAMPSLHAAYLPIAAYWAYRAGLKRAAVLFIGIAAGIWWAAVYSSHHYLLDVLLGITCATTGILVFTQLLHWSTFSRWIERYRRRLEPPLRVLHGARDRSNRRIPIHHEHVTTHH